MRQVRVVSRITVAMQTARAKDKFKSTYKNTNRKLTSLEIDELREPLVRTEYTGLFHRWMSERDEDGLGYVVGVVEKDDGSIETPSAGTIIFQHPGSNM